MVSKNTICLWYDGTALDAATFYAKTFPDSAVGTILRAPDDYPAAKRAFNAMMQMGKIDVAAIEAAVKG